MIDGVVNRHPGSNNEDTLPAEDSAPASIGRTSHTIEYLLVKSACYLFPHGSGQDALTPKDRLPVYHQSPPSPVPLRLY